MKKIGIAAIAAAGFATVIGLAAPAQADVSSPTIDQVALSFPRGVDHLNWLNDIQPKVNVPKVDTSPRHSGGAR